VVVLKPARTQLEQQFQRNVDFSAEFPRQISPAGLSL